MTEIAKRGAAGRHPHRRVRLRGSRPRCARSRTRASTASTTCPSFPREAARALRHTAGEVSRIALVVDAREGRFLADAPRVIQEIRQQGADVEVLFLDASDESLVRRYSETRRRHPLAGDSGTVPDGIAAERRALAELKAIADEVDRHDDAQRPRAEAARDAALRLGRGGTAGRHRGLVRVPLRAPDPRGPRARRAVPPEPVLHPRAEAAPGNRSEGGELRPRPAGREGVPRADRRPARVPPAPLPREGKSYLTIAIGCTGGKHRSVALAGALAERLEAGGQPVRLWHRDVEKE